MVEKINRKSALWLYLDPELKGLIYDGELLIQHADNLPQKISDYSFLVFPFSKAYEGFLKRLFLDLDLIKEDEYYGEDIRIGRVLNPHYVHEHQNVFNKLCSATGERGTEMAEKLWKMWKEGRNLVFHYFPHNFRRLSFEEATEIIDELLVAMESAVSVCHFSGKVHSIKSN